MSWDAAHYLRFADERTRPAAELAGRVMLDAPRLIADLGCGPGNSTAVLRARYPDATITGVDNDADMLAKARASGVDAAWVDADCATWTPDAPHDLIFSNALFQWLNDHETLFPRLMSHLTPGGVFAIQMPRNFDAPSHVLLRATARSGPWAETLSPLLREDPVGDGAAYTDILEPHASRLDVWETIYVQRLTGPDAVLNWVKGTALVPLMAALDPETRAAFLAAYAARLRDAYPMRANGVTLFPFRRIFIVATR